MTKIIRLALYIKYILSNIACMYFDTNISLSYRYETKVNEQFIVSDAGIYLSNPHYYFPYLPYLHHNRQGLDYNPKHADRNPQLSDSNPRVTDHYPRLSDCDLRLTDSNPGVVDCDPELRDNDPRVIDRYLSVIDSNPKDVDSNPSLLDYDLTTPDLNPQAKKAFLGVNTKQTAVVWKVQTWFFYTVRQSNNITLTTIAKAGLDRHYGIGNIIVNENIFRTQSGFIKEAQVIHWNTYAS